MTNLFLILILLHVLGDFYFQSSNIAKLKNQKYKYVVLHSLIYSLTFLLSFIFYEFSISLFIAVFLLNFMHFIIDSIKYILINKIKINKSLFIIDQVIHILCLLLVVLFFYRTDYIIFIQRFNLNAIQKYLQFIVSVLLIFKPANIFIKNILNKNNINSEIELSNENSPLRLGRMIGNFERLLILLLLCVNQYVVIGYIFTAKSIARWKKLTEDKDFAEYYLVGTLLSVIISIAVYFVFIKGVII